MVKDQAATKMSKNKERQTTFQPIEASIAPASVITKQNDYYSNGYSSTKRLKHDSEVKFAEMNLTNQELVNNTSLNDPAYTNETIYKKYDYNNYEDANFQYQNYYYYHQQFNNSLNNNQYDSQYNYNQMNPEQAYYNNTEIPVSFCNQDNLATANCYLYNTNIHSQYASNIDGTSNAYNINSQDTNQAYLSSSLSSCSSSSSSTSSLSNTISPIPSTSYNYETNPYQFNQFSQASTSFSA